jgi:Penicillin tolerance protein
MEFARTHDLILFVAGVSSSNGRVLFDLCRSANPRTYRIGGPSDIDPSWIRDGDHIGVCGATSTPKWLLEAVADAVRG